MRRAKKRRGIEVILAEVIMIAISLVAATALAGYAFGLFGTLGSSANVKVGVTPTCSMTADQCTLKVSNSGTLDGSITACAIGSSAATAGAAKVQAGGTITEVCSFTAGTFAGFNAVVGTSVSGTITVNGKLVSWAGTYAA